MRRMGGIGHSRGKKHETHDGNFGGVGRARAGGRRRAAARRSWRARAAAMREQSREMQAEAERRHAVARWTAQGLRRDGIV